MAATASPGVVSRLIQRLPRRLLAALDAWSYRLARKRHLERMRKWHARQLVACTPGQLPSVRRA